MARFLESMMDKLTALFAGHIYKGGSVGMKEASAPVN
jgi:hypothetical protein